MAIASPPRRQKPVVVASTVGMDRKTWLELRRQGIGGSDAAAVVGLDPYRSPLDVYIDKVYGAKDEPAGEAAEWGIELEDVIARKFAERTGLRVVRRNAVLRHPEHPFMLASVDRLVYDGKQLVGPLDCKNVGFLSRREWENGEAPARYIVQVSHYMAVLDTDTAYLAALIGGQRLVIVRVERDREAEAKLVEAERAFWQMVENRTPPDPDGSMAAERLLARLHPEAKPGTTVEVPTALLAAYARAKEQADAAERTLREAEQKIKAALGDSEVGLLNGCVVVTWKNVTQRRLDTEALKKQRPEIYEEFSMERTARRFVVHVEEVESDAP